MKYIEDYIRDRTTDLELRSHLFGIVKECGFYGSAHNTLLDGNDLSRLWDRFGTYTRIAVHAERVHGGTEIHLSQFVDSAIGSWRTQRG